MAATYLELVVNREENKKSGKRKNFADSAKAARKTKVIIVQRVLCMPNW